MSLPKNWAFLLDEGGPKMLVEALKLYGTIETPGKGNNPTILAWAKEIGQSVAKMYTADSIPWCGLAMGVVAKRAGKDLPKDPLWALNWGTFGTYIEEPELGDILVYTRITPDGKKAGHVHLYVGQDNKSYFGLGGNQSDAFNIARMAKSRLYTSRRPIYSIATPPNVRKIYVTTGGVISDNEQ